MSERETDSDAVMHDDDSDASSELFLSSTRRHRRVLRLSSLEDNSSSDRSMDRDINANEISNDYEWFDPKGNRPNFAPFTSAYGAKKSNEKVQNCRRVEDFYALFVTDEMFEHISEQTNLYAAQYRIDSRQSGIDENMAEVIIQTSRKMLGNSSVLSYHFCEQILYIEIGNSRIKAWDVIIFIPNLLFLLILIARFNRARLKLRATSSPIFITFYGLVLVNVIISLIRCSVSMTLSAAVVSGGYTDKILWVIVRFFMLSTEMSVVIFGLAFGHLDSRSSIRHVLLATSFISLAFSITQGTLEVITPDSFSFGNNNIFRHGGMLFWFITSLIFTVAYFLVLILPWTKLRERLVLPTRHSFYMYIFLLAVLDLVQTIGSGLLYYGGFVSGLCMVDVTSCIYFTMFTPLVFHTFLNEFFSITQPSIMFSYKAQIDDAMEEDNVSLPHQQSFSSLKTDSDCIYQSNSVYDSTHFDSHAPVNPLYAASLQSPDSIAGYSIDSSSSLDGYQQNAGNHPH